MRRLVLALALVVPAPVLAQGVVSTSPAQNTLNVSLDADLSATFDVDMDPATITDATFVVHGVNDGVIGGTVSYDGGSRTATFDPDDGFSAGDVITVVLTTGVESAGGASLGGFVWTFTAVTTPAPALFPLSFEGFGGSSTSVAVTDVDGDGDLDVSTGDSAAGGPSGVTLHVFRNPGDGSLDDRESSLVLGSQPRAIVTTDMDGDGVPDAVAGNYGDGDVSIAIGNGDATFAEETRYPATFTSSSLAAADLDADGDRDIVVGYQFGVNLGVLLNEGGALGAQTQYVAGSAGVPSVVVADLDRDGDLDVAATDFDSDQVSVLLNDGDGTLAARTTYATEAGPFWVAAGDVDGDGHVDLAVVNSGGASMSILRNLGDGSFDAAVSYPVGTMPQGICLADLDGDGHLDAAVADHIPTPGDDLYLLMNQGDGTFAEAASFELGTRAWTVASGDADQDGDVDLVVGLAGSDNVVTLINDVEVAVGSTPGVPSGFRIEAVTPTPFHPLASVRFQLPEATEVSAEVLTVAGERVRTLATGLSLGEGTHELRWDGRADDGHPLPSGVYYVRITSPLGVETARAVRVR